MDVLEVASRILCRGAQLCHGDTNDLPPKWLVVDPRSSGLHRVLTAPVILYQFIWDLSLH